MSGLFRDVVTTFVLLLGHPAGFFLLVESVSLFTSMSGVELAYASPVPSSDEEGFTPALDVDAVAPDRHHNLEM